MGHIDLAEYQDQGDMLEQTTLGCLLLDEQTLKDIGALRPRDFQRSEHQVIFAAIQRLSKTATPVDVLTVSDHLKQSDELNLVGGWKYLHELAMSVQGTNNLAEYARRVRERAQLRAVIGAVTRAQEIVAETADPAQAFEQINNLLTVVGRNITRDEPELLVRQLDYVLAEALDDGDDSFDDELIEGTLGRGAMAVLYGDSNSGKTFAAIDLGAAVCQSRPWMDRPTDGGLVVYLASESPTSVQNRLRAYQRYHGAKVPGFVIVRSPINLFDGQADTAAVIGLVAALEREHGVKAALIIGDTLARLAVGANENSGEDMGVVVQNIDAIRAATGAAFLVIHHTGKDAAKGMRGWSGLRAATDTEIEVTADEATGLRSAEITKQRDLPGKGDRIGFRLQVVTLGQNRWGTERGSCVVEPSEAPEKRKAKRRSEVAGAIEEFLHARGTGCFAGALVKHFEGRFVRQSVYRELGKMIDMGELIRVDKLVSLPGRPGGAK